MLNKIIRIINILEVIVLILLLSFSTIKIITWNKENFETKELIKEINTYKESKNDTPNLKDSKSKNNDTIGWIKVNNTNIDYPFVQSNDNNYYLTHNFNKKKTSSGWVFLDKRNNKNLRLSKLNTTLHTILPMTFTTTTSKNLSLYNKLATRD